MDPIGAYLLHLLPQYGPWVLFVLAFLETSFVTGLVVPSGMATTFATALAVEGDVELGPIVAAAAAGGALGDTAGYWVGKIWGVRILTGRSRLARVARVRHSRLNDFFGRHPVYSVTVGRMIAFARTLMPMAAGMSGISYRAFIFYQFFGLMGWLGLYVGIGLVAGESWEAVARWVGAGGAAVFVVAGLFMWIFWRTRRGLVAPPRDRTLP